MSELINLVAVPAAPVYTQCVAEATVRTEVGAQGVLVPGGFILTATHRLSWDAEHHHPEDLITDTAAGAVVADVADLTPEAVLLIVSDQIDRRIIHILISKKIEQGFIPKDQYNQAFHYATYEACDLVSKTRDSKDPDRYDRHVRWGLRRRLRVWTPDTRERVWPPPDKFDSVEDHVHISQLNESAESGRRNRGYQDPWSHSSGKGHRISWASRALTQGNPDDDAKDGDMESWDRPQHGKRWNGKNYVDRCTSVLEDSQPIAQAHVCNTEGDQARREAQAEAELMRRVDEPGRLRGGTHQIARRLIAEKHTLAEPEEVLAEIAYDIGRDIGWVKKAVAEVARKLGTCKQKQPQAKSPRMPAPARHPEPVEPTKTKMEERDGKPVKVTVYPLVDRNSSGATWQLRSHDLLMDRVPITHAPSARSD